MSFELPSSKGIGEENACDKEYIKPFSLRMAFLLNCCFEFVNRNNLID